MVLNPPPNGFRLKGVKAQEPTPTTENSPRDLWGIALVVVSLLLAGAAIWARRQIEFDPDTIAKDSREAGTTATPSPTPAR